MARASRNRGWGGVTSRSDRTGSMGPKWEGRQREACRRRRRGARVDRYPAGNWIWVFPEVGERVRRESGRKGVKTPLFGFDFGRCRKMGFGDFRDVTVTWDRGIV